MVSWNIPLLINDKAMTNRMKKLFKKDGEEKAQVPMLPESDILEVRDFALNG